MRNAYFASVKLFLQNQKWRNSLSDSLFTYLIFDDAFLPQILDIWMMGWKKYTTEENFDNKKK